MACITGLGYSLLASVLYVADGSTSDFDFAFPFLFQDAYIASNGTATKSASIRVFVQSGGGAWIEQTSGWTMPTATTARFSTDPAASANILIRRDSKRSLLRFDGVNGSTLDADDDLDLIYLNNIYLIQELSDDIFLANCVIDNTSTVYAGNVYYKTGNASWTTFPLNDGTTTEIGLSSKQVAVHIEGIYQQESTYSVADSGGISTITFSTAPPTGYVVEARILSSAVVPVTTLGNGTVTCDTLAVGAICSLDKFDLDSLAAAKQLLSFNPTLGIRTIDSTWISDFNTAVRASSLDQMAIPTANINLNTHKIINVVDPTSNQDAATKKYVDDQLTTVTTTNTPKIKTLAYTTVTANTEYTISVGFDWDSVDVSTDQLGAFNSQKAQQILTPIAAPNPGAYSMAMDNHFTVLSTEAVSFVQGNYFSGVSVSIKKSGNNCVIKSSTSNQNFKLRFYKDAQ